MLLENIVWRQLNFFYLGTSANRSTGDKGKLASSQRCPSEQFLLHIYTVARQNISYDIASSCCITSDILTFLNNMLIMYVFQNDILLLIAAFYLDIEN